MQAVLAEAQGGERQFVEVFGGQPVGDRAYASAGGDHAQQDLRVFNMFVAARAALGRREEEAQDIQPFILYRVAQQDFFREVRGPRHLLCCQRVGSADDQHHLIAEQGREAESRGAERVRGDQHVNVMLRQRRYAAELEFPADVDVHLRPAGQKRRDHAHQPAVAGMAFHPDPQAALPACGERAQDRLGMIELRQQALGHAAQVMPGLGEAQPASVFVQERRARLLFESADGMAQRGLAQVQGPGGGGQGAQAMDFMDDGQMRALQHGRPRGFMKGIHYYMKKYQYCSSFEINMLRCNLTNSPGGQA